MRFSEQKAIFDSWLGTYKGVLFKVVRAYAFTRHDQEDLFQEIAIAAWVSVPGFQGNSAVDLGLSRGVEHRDLVVPQRAQATRQDQ